MNLIFRGKRLAIALSLAFLAIGTMWARADGYAPDCYILSAGVDNYPNAPKLNGDLGDANNTVAAFKSQQGRLFGKVVTQVLLDGQATRGNILQHMQNFTRVGKAGDFVVLFLSGHGGRFAGPGGWYFLPYDYNPQNAAATTLAERAILDAADVLVRQGKKVVIIIDACYSGQLIVTAQDYFTRYRDPNGGGLIVMVSSSATETSAALGAYSAFAKAFADSMAGGADLNHDGKITLQEIRQYSYSHTNELLRQKGMNKKQESQVTWSPSIPGNMVLALASFQPNPQVTTNPQATQWTGSETLAGFGSLTFQFLTGGRVVMFDAKSTSEGTWRRDGQKVSLFFSGGRVVYTGTLNGSTLSGTAHNERTTWSFSVTYQTPANAAARPMQWTGSENLSGFGNLTFQLFSGGRAVMFDTAGTTEGTWQQNGQQIVLRFHGGRVVYSGTVSGSVLSGTAQNERTSWSFSVALQNPA